MPDVLISTKIEDALISIAKRRYPNGTINRVGYDSNIAEFTVEIYVLPHSMNISTIRITDEQIEKELASLQNTYSPIQMQTVTINPALYATCAEQVGIRSTTTIIAGENRMITREGAEALARNAAEMLAKVEEIEHKYGVDDDYNNRDGFYAEIRYANSETVYTYFFLKANGFWYSTGHTPTAFKRGTFNELINWLETRNGEVVNMGLLKRCKPFVKNGKVL